MFFTDEEKAKHKLALLKAYEPFKLVQRYIVLLFTIPYVALHVMVILGCIRVPAWVAKLLKSLKCQTKLSLETQYLTRISIVGVLMFLSSLQA